MCSAQAHVRSTPNSDRKSEIPQKAMSALPPKADMCGATRDVRFGPIADMVLLFDHIVSGQKNAIWYGDAKRFRGLEINY
jgi:hypothetical protein